MCYYSAPLVPVFDWVFQFIDCLFEDVDWFFLLVVHEVG